MKFNLIPPAFIVLVVLLTSCSQKSNVPVPEDAAIILHIDGNSLGNKLPWDEIRQSEWFKIANEETKDSLVKKVLNNPDESGIDIKSDLFIFMKNQGRGAYAVVTGIIKDEKIFTGFVEKTSNITTSKEGDLSVVRSDKAVMTWKDNRFVFIADAPDFNTGGAIMGDRRYEENRSFTPDSLVKFAQAVHSIKGKSSVGSNSRFTTMMKEKGDMHFWMNAGKMYGGALPAMMAITKASLLLEGNITAATLNFDNGKITIDGKSYYNKELEALYKKYPMKNLDEAMLKKIPSQNIAAVVAMNYPPEGLKEFLTLLGLDGIANMFLGQAGFSTDEFIKANKGDILFAVSDFQMKVKEMQYDMDGQTSYSKSTQPDAKIIFAASVKDKTAFEKMITVLREKLSGGGGAGMFDKIPYQLQDNWFIAGSDSATVFAFGTSSTDHAFISKISGHPMGAFVDIQKFISGSKPAYASDTTATRIADESLKVWKDITMYGGEFKGNAAISH
ncbi:MAG TPA: DUF4836 family protein, partial [Chitinophagaceae bacterium]|nr:DUF4836 family protein [Chitinophagaceae bacterium]